MIVTVFSISLEFAVLLLVHRAEQVAATLVVQLVVQEEGIQGEQQVEQAVVTLVAPRVEQAVVTLVERQVVQVEIVIYRRRQRPVLHRAPYVQRTATPTM